MRGRRLLIGRNSVNVRLATIDDINQLADLRMLQQREDWGGDYEDYDGNFYNRTVSALKQFISICKKKWQDNGVYVGVS